MNLPRPSSEEIAAAAAHYGFHLSDGETAEHVALTSAALNSYDTVARLYAGIAPVSPPRAWTRPQSEENPYNAWYVTSDISTGAEGPLSGKRIAVKDNVAVAGIPMMNGSRSLEGFVPSEDATVVTRLLDAGATIAGKAVCEDLCFSGSSFTAATGPLPNPWNPEYANSGSSSGSAALLAGGVVDLAIGCDQGGSIRMPAAWGGVVGHKPTWGLVPYSGCFPIERTIDHVGPMGTSVSDVAAMLHVMAGRDGLDPRQPDDLVPQDFVAAVSQDVTGLRVGVLREGFGIPGMSDDRVDDLVRASVATLEAVGAVVSDVSVPIHGDGAFDIWAVIATDGAAYQMFDGNGYGLNSLGYTDPEAMEFFSSGRRAHADEIAANVRHIALSGHYGLTRFGGSYYARARRLVPGLIAAYDAALADVDVLVMPTIPFLPGRLLDAGAASISETVGAALGTLFNTAPFDATGHPGISVPAGLVDGLPVGMMMVGRRFDDATVLRAAAGYERAAGPFLTAA
ncbi:amidase [Microbacterium sp. NPDC077184]|uniref:amidase n=1 Tax=Microbacterium sp. NPDC077184 TaxID=3154764 RepID=UPI003425A2EF